MQMSLHFDEFFDVKNNWEESQNVMKTKKRESLLTFQLSNADVTSF